MKVTLDFTPRWLKFVLEMLMEMYEALQNIYYQNWAYFHPEVFHK